MSKVVTREEMLARVDKIIEGRSYVAVGCENCASGIQCKRERDALRALIENRPRVSRNWITEFAGDIRDGGNPYETILPPHLRDKWETAFFWTLEKLLAHKLTEAGVEVEE